MRRSEQFQEGDTVELWPEPLHEGPHPDHVEQAERLAVIVAAQRHPSNAEWITGYLIDEFDPDGIAHRIEVRPGSIRRLREGR